MSIYITQVYNIETNANATLGPMRTISSGFESIFIIPMMMDIIPENMVILPYISKKWRDLLSVSVSGSLIDCIENAFTIFLKPHNILATRKGIIPTITKLGMSMNVNILPPAASIVPIIPVDNSIHENKYLP